MNVERTISYGKEVVLLDDEIVITNVIRMPEYGCSVGLCEGVLFSAPLFENDQTDDESWGEVCNPEPYGEFIPAVNKVLGTNFTDEQFAGR